MPPERTEHDRGDAVLTGIEGPKYTAALTAGRALTLEQAVQEARATRHPVAAHPTDTAG